MHVQASCGTLVRRVSSLCFISPHTIPILFWFVPPGIRWAEILRFLTDETRLRITSWDVKSWLILNVRGISSGDFFFIVLATLLQKTSSKPLNLYLSNWLPVSEGSSCRKQNNFISENELGSVLSNSWSHGDMSFAFFSRLSSSSRFVAHWITYSNHIHVCR